MKKLIFLFLLISFAVKAQVPIEIPVPVKVVNAYSMDWKRGPWATTAAAKSGIPQSIRVGGLTVWINACSCEYHWLDTDLTDSGLVPVAVPGWVLSGTTSLTGNAVVDAGANSFELKQSTTSGWLNSIKWNIGSNGLQLTSSNSSYGSSLYLDETNGITLSTTGSSVIAIDASGSSSQNVFLKGNISLNSTFITNDNTKTKVLVMDGAGGNERLYYNNNFILNPMTAQYDIVVGGSSGTPARLGKGSDNTFLGIQSGVLSYYSFLSGDAITPGTQSFNWGGTISNDVLVDDSSEGTHSVYFGANANLLGLSIYTKDPSATGTDDGKVDFVMGTTAQFNVYNGDGTNTGYLTLGNGAGLSAGFDGGINLSGGRFGGAFLTISSNDISFGPEPSIGSPVFDINAVIKKFSFSNAPVLLSSGASTYPSLIFPETLTGPTSPTSGMVWYDGAQLLFRRGSDNTTLDILAAVKSINVSGGSTGLTFSGGPITTGGTITMSGTLAKANGGTGTASPSLVAGTNVTITGSWPNQTISASAGAAVWGTITGTLSSQSDLNTALSAKADAATYTGSTSIAVLGTINTGTWHGSGIGVAYGGTGQSSVSPGYMLYGSSTPNNYSLLAPGTSNQSLTIDPSTTLPVWSSVNIVDLNNASVASSTITLDLNNQYQRMFVGSNTFSTPKTLALANTTNTRVFDLHFEVTSTSATLTFPSIWLMSDSHFSAHVWTPPSTGKYELSGTFDGNYWKIKIAGPFL